MLSLNKGEGRVPKSWFKNDSLLFKLEYVCSKFKRIWDCAFGGKTSIAEKWTRAMERT